eukprot:g7289.t1
MRDIYGAHRRAYPRLLLSALVIVSAPGGPRGQSWAQDPCGNTSTTPIQVENVEGARALDAAVNCADGGAVEAVWVGLVTLDAPISIGSGSFLSITGQDPAAEVHGGAQIRLFDVSSSGSLALANLTLSGGSGDNGGAIYATSATVALDGCVFEGNDATAGDGGAVWMDGGELTVVGGEFSDNSASGSGGAVLAVDARVVIEGGTVFAGNTATLEGGGLYCGGVENSTAANAAPSCSLSGAVFRSNNASLETDIVFPDIWTPNDQVDGGGGAAFWFVDVDITNSVFEFNHAQLAGGAIFGGNSSRIKIDKCAFWNNTTTGYGGAVAASSAWLGGNTRLAYNSADENGGGVFMWDSEGAVEFNDTVCNHNTAEHKGGCIFTDGRGVFNPGVTMEGNVAEKGACIYTFGRADVTVLGGEFTGCRSTGNGGFMFVSDGAVVVIMGGTVSNCVAERRAGVVYCSGDSYNRGGSKVTIEGGTFSNNRALELGGAIVAWGTTSGGPTPTVVTITGGLFRNNTAKFYGGFIFLEELASLSCEGATIRDHYAGDQGGAIYGRDATWVNSTCDLIGNGAPQGAAVYLTHTAGGAKFKDHTIADEMGSGVSAMYAADTSILARRVSFESGVAQKEDAPNRAVRLEGEAALFAEECVFSGWMGDTVIHNSNPAAGSLVLEKCDFTQTSSTMTVVSPNSDAEIRNAYVGDGTFENAIMVNGSAVLVDRVLNCEDPNACGPGQCVDSDLGVLCECLENGDCLGRGGDLSIDVRTEPAAVTYSPDEVYYELTVAAGEEGTTPAIWNLTIVSDDLALLVFPSSGVLLPGDEATVSVTGTPLREDVGGDLVSRFIVRSVVTGASGSTNAVELKITSAFFFCQAYEYAALPDDDDPDSSVLCEQCVTIVGDQGVDCERPGATLHTLPIREGYWRSSPGSLTIHPCLYSEACGGGTKVSSSDDYCREGYRGPYCAVCKEGYGTVANNVCHSCTDAKSRWLIFAGFLFILVMGLLVVLLVVFLAGGLDGVDTVHQSLSRTWSSSGRALGLSRSGSTSGLGTSSSRSSRARLSSYSARLGGLVRENKFTTAASSGVPVAPSSNDTSENENETADPPHKEASSPRSGDSSDNDVSVRGTVHCRRAAFARSAGPPSRQAMARKKSGCAWGLGESVKRWASRVPMNKVKILVVVWQILTVFPSVSGVDYPANYSRFLMWIDVVNFDLGSILSASCLVGRVDLYQRLLLTTLTPLGLVLVLVCTYWVAKRRAGTGSASVLARRAAWTRHMAAGLLLAFLVLTSTSTVVFQIFACDEEAVEGESYLRADYSLSCDAKRRMWYKVYAGVMILVYPIGIPLMYAYILWTNRESLNPKTQPDGGAVDPQASRRPRRALSRMDNTHTAKESPAELKERLRKRSLNPDLLPSMFLWKDFGGSLYFFEVIDCGRRILLTGALVFIAPNTATQAAVACMLAFASLLGFELLRPHLDTVDSWLYRLGCVVIFLSNFLALLIKADAAGDRNCEVLGGILVAVNVLLFVAVAFATWFATHQAVADTRDGAEALGVARAVLTFEKQAAASARFTRQHTSTSKLFSAPSVAVDSRADSGPTAGSLVPGGGGDVGRAVAGGPDVSGPSNDNGSGGKTAVQRQSFFESKEDEG